MKLWATLQTRENCRNNATGLELKRQEHVSKMIKARTIKYALLKLFAAGYDTFPKPGCAYCYERLL